MNMSFISKIIRDFDNKHFHQYLGTSSIEISKFGEGVQRRIQNAVKRPGQQLHVQSEQ